jgi:hypothetical protein
MKEFFIAFMVGMLVCLGVLMIMADEITPTGLVFHQESNK